MTIGKNITLWFLILALLAVLGNAIAIQRIFGDAEASAVIEARHIAQLIALTIGSVQETGPAEPLFANPVALEGYVSDLQRLGRHIEVVDTHKTIIAAVQPELVGRADAGDPADEVALTIADGIDRAFVEPPADELGDTRAVVVRLEAETGETLGAVIVGYTSLYDERIAAARTNVAIITGATLGAAILALVLGLGFSRRVGRAMTQLQSAADEIARGNTDVHVAVDSRDEIGAVAGAFNQMAAGLARSRAELHRNADELIAANERLKLLAGRAEALVRIAARLNAQLDIDAVLQTVCVETAHALNVPAVSVILFDEQSGSLRLAAVHGLPAEFQARFMLPAMPGAGERALSAATRVVPDVQLLSGYANAALYADLNIRTIVASGLVREGKLVGSINIFTLGAVRSFTEEEQALLKGAADQAAQAIVNARLFADASRMSADLQRSNIELTLAYDTTLEGWSHALDLRDKETEGHTQRVTELTLRIVRGLGLSEAELLQARRGALLHDIGKMGVPDSILLKPGPLTEEEWVIMRMHPVYAYELLSPIGYLRPALDIPYCHHEKWDGNGYPRGLQGEQIPLAARVFAVIDVWDALRSNRPYRQAWPEERVRAHIRSLAGSHFDPKVVDDFLAMM